LGASNNKWANVYATTFNGNVIGDVTGNVSGSAGSCAGNAATATKTGDASIWLYSENTNEINFGGNSASAGDAIYFGYRAKDNKVIPTKFIFGSGTGTADL
jgi:hypothetical protein